MGSDDDHHRHRSRRSRPDEAGGDDDRSHRASKDGGGDGHRRRRSRDRERDRDSDRRRERRRSRSREKKDRRRSRTPGSPERERRRSRSRDRDRERRRRRSPRAGDDKDRGSGKEVARRRRHSDSDPEAAADGKKRRASPLRRAGPLPSQGDSFAVSNGEEPEKPKEKPNLRTTGILAAASNSVQQADGTSIVLKYHEPAEARKPPARDQWRLFVFKGADIVDTIDLSPRSCWLVGREAAVVDLVAEHPSISKQHAVVQFRHVEKRNEFGDRVGKVKPYLIDLESANGTTLNGDKVADSRYYELRDKDMIKFGHSTREYVLMLAPRE